jgi:hypothetical protein
VRGVLLWQMSLDARGTVRWWPVSRRPDRHRPRRPPAARRRAEPARRSPRHRKARKNYAATSPITRASGKRRLVAARFVHNARLVDALNAQAFASLRVSFGARAFYDEQRASGHEHNDALRRLANRLVGILHGCLKTRTTYNEATAWAHRDKSHQTSLAA